MKKINNTFCYKQNVYGEWQEGSLSDLESRLTSRETPLTTTEKNNLPLFGYNMPLDTKSSTLVFPVSFVIIELDTPEPFKSKIKNGNKALEKEWIDKFIELYITIKNCKDLDFYSMYLTSSMRGLRFILKLEHPIFNKDGYKAVGYSFLEKLALFGIDKSYFDFEVNRGWYVPTFKKYFLKTGKTFFFSEKKEKKQVENTEKKEKTLEIAKKTQKNQEKDFLKIKKCLDKVLCSLRKKRKSITHNYSDWVKVGFALLNSLPYEIALFYFLEFSKLDADKYDFQKCSDKLGQLKKCIPLPNPIRFPTIIYMAKQKGVKFEDKDFQKLPKEHQDLIFWSQNNKSEIIINFYRFCRFLSYHGFHVYNRGKGHYLIVLVNNNIVRESSIIEIKQFLKEYFLNKGRLHGGIRPEALLNKLYKGNNSYFGGGLLQFLDKLETPPNKDTKDTAFFYFQNCVIKVTANKISKTEYNNLKGHVWENQISKHDFHQQKNINKQCDYARFLFMVAGENEKKCIRLRSILGFLLHNYKVAKLAKAVIFRDSFNGIKANGGTGKSLLAKSIGKLRVAHIIDGKNFNNKSQFKFQQVGWDTQIVIFDDIIKNFQFELLFSVITGDWIIERKNKDAFAIPFLEAPKTLITSNYPVKFDNGESDKRRKIEFIFSDTFNQKNTPFKVFGKDFFQDWNESEWDDFYNIMIRCIQEYFNNGIPKPEMHLSQQQELTIETNSCFAEYAEKHLLNVINGQLNGFEFDKSVLYQEFLGMLKEPKNKISQRSFTIYIKTTFCDLYNLDFSERPSNGKNYIAFYNKVVK